MKICIYVAAALLSVAVAGCAPQCGCETEKESLSQAAEAYASALGDVQVHKYSGVVQLGANGGVRYTLTVKTPEHSGNGEFDLLITDIDSGGKEETATEYHGKRYTQRGMPGDNDAIVWQLKAGDGNVFNFLYDSGENTLTLLNDNFELAGVASDCTLKSVE